MKRHANIAFFVPHAGCPNRCLFCNQHRISGAPEAPTPQAVRAQCAQALPPSGDPACGRTEIAFFGGSFTAVDRALQSGLLDAALPFVRAGRAVGIRLSTRPDAVDAETLGFLAAHGVTAIELGAQSMDDRVLRLNRRGHTAADVEAAAGRIKAHPAGFELGLQMMIGLYGEDDPAAAAHKTAAQLAALAPDTVRIYPTIVVENTPLCALYRAGSYTPLTVEAAAGITAGLLELFGRAGVRVIRAGLHSDESLRAGAVAGPEHPAFGEIAQSLLFRRQLAALAEPGAASLRALVNPADVSRAVGHGRMNAAWFAGRGICLRVAADAAVPPGTVQPAGTANADKPPARAD